MNDSVTIFWMTIAEKVPPSGLASGRRSRWNEVSCNLSVCVHTNARFVSPAIGSPAFFFFSRVMALERKDP